MNKKVLLLFLLCLVQLFFSQNIKRIEFESYNAIVFGSKVHIVIKPIKRNKKSEAKMRVEYKKNTFLKRISHQEYVNICNNILNIKEKIYANTKDSIKTSCLDGSSTNIIIFQNSTKKEYFLDCISPEDKTDEEKKDFWYATKFILETAGMKIENVY
jgi:hypothetical protein